MPEEIMLRIVRAEDERRWAADDLGALLSHADARVRRRAAIAAGRIGDERAVPALADRLQNDKEASVREAAAFALGETESPSATDALLAALGREGEREAVRARALEAAGKIAAALPKSDEERARVLGNAILNALRRQSQRGDTGSQQSIILAITAALRARATGAGPLLAELLSHRDARVRADAANALARLRSKDGTEKLRPLLLKDTDPLVRANAARALGMAEDQASFEPLLILATKDADARVRVSAVRALASLKDARAAQPLLQRGASVFAKIFTGKYGELVSARPAETGELLEIAAALGRLLANTGDTGALAWLRDFRKAEAMTAPEVEVAFARVSPGVYLREPPFKMISERAVRVELQGDWRVASSLAQGLGEITGMSAETAGSGVVSLQADAQIILLGLLDDQSTPAPALPDVLRAVAAFKGGDQTEALRKALAHKDVIVRATAAELLASAAPSDANARALADALPASLRDEMNDAALAVLDALAKQKSAQANDAIKTALDSTDYLVRRRAAALLKANGAGDFQERVGAPATRNTVVDYRRALARADKQVRAVVSTDKGQFAVELLAADAPLNVDNFVQLARRGFFNGVAFHRVVPNFVVQGGDPRGDGNGGPGYQIRCEINEVPYDRGAVGMALSGKDTGGSQWFVTHSPQPHLDGGYTVFGRVVAGMDVVDRVTRGDLIRNVLITETARAAPKAEAAPARRKAATNEGSGRRADAAGAKGKRGGQQGKRAGSNEQKKSAPRAKDKKKG